MNQLLNCKWKLEDIKHNARALLYIRPMRQDWRNWRNIFCLNVKKPNNRSKGNSDDQKWLQSPCSKAGRIKQNQPPTPPPCALPWKEGMKELAETATFHLATHRIAGLLSGITTTNGCGISPQARDTDVPRAESSYLWQRPGEYFFFLFTLIQWLSGLTTPAHHHGIESHGNRTRTISDFLLHAFSSKTPKGSVPDAAVRNARDKQEY